MKQFFILGKQKIGITKKNIIQDSLIIFILIQSFLVLPWGLRDLKLGAEIPFKVNPNSGPENIDGFIKWQSSFSLTEYDHASALYPIFTRKVGDRKNVKIIINLFNLFIFKFIYYW